MPRRPTAPARVALLAAAALGAGCTSEAELPKDPKPTAGSPAAAHLDLSLLPVPRRELCSRLPDDGVEKALAGAVMDTDHYGNGDTFEPSPGLVDVSHEYGCVFHGPRDVSARAWVFARPVASEEADSLVTQERAGTKCAFPGSVQFGTPGETSVCEVPGPDGSRLVRARLQGLFTDTWVGCEVSEPLEPLESPPAADPSTVPADVVQRAEQWCTEVVTVAAAS